MGTPNTTLARMLGDSANPAQLLPERRAWFCNMLRNVIANSEDAIRFWRAYRPDSAYTPDKIDAAIKRHQQRIAECEAAIVRLNAEDSQ
jgi:hypothetical protein